VANIHAFPQWFSDEAVRRLTERLTASFEAGEDLGSRAPHIHALAGALERTLLDLKQELANLEAVMAPADFRELIRTTRVDTISNQLKSLISQARAFPIIT